MTKNPAEQARHDILHSVADAARVSGGERSVIVDWARIAWVSQNLAENTADWELVSMATDSVHRFAMQIAGVPARTAGEIAYKLAQLLSELLWNFDDNPSSVERLSLAASALADCVALGAAPVASDGTAYKTARLLTEMLKDFDGYPNSVEHLALAASALADFVMLGAGPLTLPDGALAGIQEGCDCAPAARGRTS